MSKVYIAGALSSKENEDRTPSRIVTDYITNIHKMCQAATVVRKRGHCPFVPAADFVFGIVGGNWEEEDYRGLSMEFLEVCDIVYVISDSWGVRKEVARAKELGIPVVYSANEIR